jgi:hypothetical protein
MKIITNIGKIILFLLLLFSGQSNEEERKDLICHGCIHLGEQINIFRHGFLGMHQQSNESLSSHISGNVLAGTVNGAIILFCQLSPSLYKILDELQTRLSKYLITAGLLWHLLF